MKPLLLEAILYLKLNPNYWNSYIVVTAMENVRTGRSSNLREVKEANSRLLLNLD